MGTQFSELAYGHFGMSGTYVVHDPVKNISICAVSSQEFGPWAKDVWPAMNDELVVEFMK